MNRAQLIIFTVIGVLILIALLVVFDVIPGVRPKPPARITLTVWGFESDRIWQELAERYSGQFPHITIAYNQKSPATYERDLLNALASGSGPDIFTLENTQIAEYIDKIQPLPDRSVSFNARDFKDIFFSASAKDLIVEDGKIIGVPVTLDTLALFYNVDILNSANVTSLPKTWEGLLEAARRLTVYTELGTIAKSGVALGTVVNIENATDILSALMLQSGIELIDRSDRKSSLLPDGVLVGTKGSAEAALSFYTSFADSSKRSYSWANFFPNSLDAFTQGKTAIIFGYAKDVLKIKEKNPHLDFDIAPFPQPEDAAVNVYYGRYQFGAVTRQSKEPVEAWKFLLWLTENANNKKFADALKLPPARRDLTESRPPEDYLEIFYNQTLAAKTWFIPNQNAVDELFSEMINSVVNKTATAEAAVLRANTRLNNLLEKLPKN